MPRRYHHAGREVEAMRFVGNGPDIAHWVGRGSIAMGSGLAGHLLVGMREVGCGDWVVRSADGAWSVWDQAVFSARFKEVRHAHVA